MIGLTHSEMAAKRDNHEDHDADRAEKGLAELAIHLLRDVQGLDTEVILGRANEDNPVVDRQMEQWYLRKTGEAISAQNVKCWMRRLLMN